MSCGTCARQGRGALGEVGVAKPQAMAMFGTPMKYPRCAVCQRVWVTRDGDVCPTCARDQRLAGNPLYQALRSSIQDGELDVLSNGEVLDASEGDAADMVRAGVDLVAPIDVEGAERRDLGFHPGEGQVEDGWPPCIIRMYYDPGRALFVVGKDAHRWSSEGWERIGHATGDVAEFGQWETAVQHMQERIEIGQARRPRHIAPIGPIVGR